MKLKENKMLPLVLSFLIWVRFNHEAKVHNSTINIYKHKWEYAPKKHTSLLSYFGRHIVGVPHCICKVVSTALSNLFGN